MRCRAFPLIMAMHAWIILIFPPDAHATAVEVFTEQAFFITDL